MPGQSLTIIINGATGVGKTTTSDHLARKLNCPCISTDYVRQRLRDRLSRQQYPVLFKSSYEIDGTPTDDNPQTVVTNYVAQAAIVVSEIGSQYLGTGNTWKIVEGVHLNSSVLSILRGEEYVILFLRMPGIQEHRRRLRQRNLLNRAMSNKHSAYFDNIRAIGTFLDCNWSRVAQKNGRIFLIDTWREVDAILGKFIDHAI